ncbi:MAG: hemolysin [Bermanella sp.]|nr:hemolysin [Bermanella sp.]|tara:strand:+ start:1242 stop:1883 length:642 start_codon:yes stop_codon:yes gene_type:complete
MLKRHLRDPFSGLSHLLGAVMSLGAIPYMLTNLPGQGSGVYLASYLVFGLSMFLMFAASAVYHLMEISEAGIMALKRVDHMAIYVMIAGSYTPFCLIGLEGAQAWWMFGIIWGIALAGILTKIFWLHAPRWFSTLLYLGMGWSSLFVYEPLSESLSDGAITWLLAGGISYSVGAVVYATKWPNLHRHFDFHDLWHVFVLGGAACHFVSIGVYL